MKETIITTTKSVTTSSVRNLLLLQETWRTFASHPLFYVGLSILGYVPAYVYVEFLFWFLNPSDTPRSFLNMLGIVCISSIFMGIIHMIVLSIVVTIITIHASSTATVTTTKSVVDDVSSTGKGVRADSNDDQGEQEGAEEKEKNKCIRSGSSSRLAGIIRSLKTTMKLVQEHWSMVQEKWPTVFGLLLICWLMFIFVVIILLFWFLPFHLADYTELKRDVNWTLFVVILVLLGFVSIPPIAVAVPCCCGMHPVDICNAYCLPETTTTRWANCCIRISKVIIHVMRRSIQLTCQSKMAWWTTILSFLLLNTAMITIVAIFMVVVRIITFFKVVLLLGLSWLALCSNLILAVQLHRHLVEEHHQASIDNNNNKTSLTTTTTHSTDDVDNHHADVSPRHNENVENGREEIFSKTMTTRIASTAKKGTAMLSKNFRRPDRRILLGFWIVTGISFRAAWEYRTLLSALQQEQELEHQPQNKHLRLPAFKKTLYSPARHDKSGAQSLEMLYHGAYAFSKKANYGGSCVPPHQTFHPNNQRLQDLVNDLNTRLPGIKTILRFGCPANATKTTMPASSLSKSSSSSITWRFLPWILGQRTVTRQWLDHLHSQIVYPPKPDPNVYIIAVHMRRGDISPCVGDKMHKYMPNTYFLDMIDKYMPTPEVLGNRTVEVVVHSQNHTADTVETLDVFRERGYTVKLEETSLADVWTELITADVFILSQSGFSVVPGLLNRDGIKVVAPYMFFQPPPGWRFLDRQALRKYKQQVRDMKHLCDADRIRHQRVGRSGVWFVLRTLGTNELIDFFNPN